MRLPLASAAALALALGVLAGCGDDESEDSGTPVVLNEAAAVDVGEGDSEATAQPGGPEVLDELEELQTASGEPSIPAIRGSAGTTVPEWMHIVNGDVAAYWQKQFNNADYRYDPAQEVIFDRRVGTACGGSADQSSGPFYCTGDQAIYLPVSFFEEQANPFGDAAVAVVIAHENGHHVQDLLGLFDTNILSAQLELQADCLAGVWAKTVYRRGLLEEGDIGEILGLVDISGDSPETAINAPGAHGSSELRRDFFAQGYNGGRPGDCPVPPKREIRG